MRIIWRVRGFLLRSMAMLTALLALAAVSCHGRGGADPAVELLAVDTPTELGSPAELLPEGEPRSAAYVEADLTRNGAEFDPLLPANLAAVDGTGCLFSPNYGPGQPLTQAAYAVYRFNLSGYDRNPQVRHAWDTAPEAGQVYFGLSEWDGDRWRWFEVDPGEPRELGEIEPFIRDTTGDLLVAVMCVGDQPSKLASLRIGSRPPLISATPLSVDGFIPVSGTIDASASSDPDGTIVKFEWDLLGDGVFEIDNGLVGTQDVARGHPGAHQAVLRVTDNDGVSSTRAFTVRAFAEWRRSWGGGNHDYGVRSVYNNFDAIYAVGTTFSFGAGSADIVLLKFDLAGVPLWQRTWGGSGPETAVDIGIAPDGNIVVLATSGGMPQLVKFTSEGTLLWAKQYSTASFNAFPGGIRLHGDSVYIGGYISNGFLAYGCVMRINGAGDLEWARNLETPATGFLAITSYAVLFTNTIACAGVSNSDLLVAHFNESGDMTGASTWGHSSRIEVASSIAVAGGFLPQVWVAGTETTGAADRVLLVQYAGGTVSRVWDAGAAASPEQGTSIALFGGNVLVGGYTESFDPVRNGLLLRYSSAGSLDFGSRLAQSGTVVNFNGGIKALPGNALVACGECGASNSTSWTSASGNSTVGTETWQSVTLPIASLPVTVQDAPGIVGTPASAVLNSGGGGRDLLIAVREMP